MNQRERRYYQTFGDARFHWLDTSYTIAFVRAAELAEFLGVPPHLFTRYINQLDAQPTTPPPSLHEMVLATTNQERLLRWEEIERLEATIPQYRHAAVKLRAIKIRLYEMERGDYRYRFETEEQRTVRIAKEEHAFRRKAKQHERDFQKFKRNNPELSAGIQEGLSRAFDRLAPFFEHPDMRRHSTSQSFLVNATPVHQD